MFDGFKMGVFCEECIIMSYRSLWNQLKIVFLVNTYDKLPWFVNLLSFYISNFSFQQRYFRNDS